MVRVLLKPAELLHKNRGNLCVGVGYSLTTPTLPPPVPNPGHAQSELMLYSSHQDAEVENSTCVAGAE